MSLRTILVPLQHPQSAASPLEAAHLLAQRFGSYVEGLALRSAVAELLALEPMAVAMLPAERTDDEVRRACRQVFLDFMRGRDVPRAGPEAAGPSCAWLDDPRAGDIVIGEHSRVFDITVIGRPGPESTSPRLNTLEAVLFESGRPILVAPPAPPRRLGETVLIAWNGSTETARTTALALPLLERASRVIVLAVTGGMVPGPGADDLARHLVLNGVAAEARTVRPDGQSTGEAILAAASTLGCDLIVKGAYTQSRLRQMIFGGATSHILASTELPVFMAH